MAEFKRVAEGQPTVQAGEQNARGRVTVPKVGLTPGAAPAVPKEVLQQLEDQAKAAPDPSAPDVAAAVTNVVNHPAPRDVARTLPHGVTRAVITAKYLWAGEYMESGLGMVDWYRSLEASRRAYAERVCRAILDASPE